MLVKAESVIHKKGIRESVESHIEHKNESHVEHKNVLNAHGSDTNK